MTTSTLPVVPYRAVALQVRCDAVNRLATRLDTQPAIDAAITRLGDQMRATSRFYGRDTRLFVLPEYILTGFPMGERTDTWIDKACIKIPGPEISRLADLATELAAFISGNSYEVDPAWPGVYFQASWLVAPDRGLVLKYRRLNSLFSPSPHDFWTEYRRRHSVAEIFPVADTAIGRLAAIASEEILYPEVARCLMAHGAEVFLHSTSDVAGHPRMPKEVAKLARAAENMAYLVSANTAGISGIDIPEDSTNGRSKIVDYRGLVLAEADQGESVVASAEIDIASLARARRQPGMANLISRQRFDLYAPVYGGHTLVPADQFPSPISQRQQLVDAQSAVIQSLIARGVIRGE